MRHSIVCKASVTRLLGRLFCQTGVVLLLAISLSRVTSAQQIVPGGHLLFPEGASAFLSGWSVSKVNQVSTIIECANSCPDVDLTPPNDDAYTLGFICTNPVARVKPAGMTNVEGKIFLAKEVVCWNTPAEKEEGVAVLKHEYRHTLDEWVPTLRYNVPAGDTSRAARQARAMNDFFQAARYVSEARAYMYEIAHLLDIATMTPVLAPELEARIDFIHRKICWNIRCALAYLSRGLMELDSLPGGPDFSDWAAMGHGTYPLSVAQEVQSDIETLNDELQTAEALMDLVY